MSEAIRGKGSKFYMGSDNSSELALKDYITQVTSIGAANSEFNLLDVEPDLNAEYEEKLPGLRKAVVLSLKGNFRTGENNEGYKLVKAAHDSASLVKFGIVRPGGMDGVGGSGYVNKIEISEAKNEGLMTWTAEFTTSGALSTFTEPLA